MCVSLFANSVTFLVYNDTVLVLNTNIPQTSLVRETRKTAEETISKQLEYVTKGHIAAKTVLF